MHRSILLAIPVLALSVLWAAPAEAQEWSPPSREMPIMPQVAELTADFVSSRSGWFGGVASISGVALSDLSIAGDARPGSQQAQVVRVTSGPLPVVTWQDRNGDSRADLIEIFRSGSVVLQVIDAEYDGRANVMRWYDRSGGLVREDRI